MEREYSKEFNVQSILAEHPNVGYKIQSASGPPRMILCTRTAGTRLEDCIEAGSKISQFYLGEEERGMPANTDVLINYRGISFSMLPNMSADDGLVAHQKAKDDLKAREQEYDPYLA